MENDLVEFDEVTKDCVHALLTNFWITRAQNLQAYMKVREREEILKGYFEDHFRLRLHVNKYLVKLEKIPIAPETWMGICDFRERKDYAFFCCFMAFLELKQPSDQFLLGTLCEEVARNMSDLQSEPLEWTDQNDRRSFARVLKFADLMGIVEIEEGNVLDFAVDFEKQALFTVTAHSQYFLRRTTQSLKTYSNFQALLDDEEGRMNEFHRLFRHLFFTPVAHCWEMTEGEKFWLENSRTTVASIIRQTTHFEMETYREAALLACPNDHSHEVFPNNKAISMVVLHFAAMMHGRVVELWEAKPCLDGCIAIPKTLFDKWLQDTHHEFGSGWSKEFRTMEIEALSREVLLFLRGWKMVETSAAEIRLFAPLIRMVGQYPDDFVSNESEVV